MTTRDVDFNSLSLKDALDLAVFIEEEARDRYVELADQLEIHHTPDAAAFFRHMAQNEEKHRSGLAARRYEKFGNEPPTIGRQNIFDVEAPDYDEARAFMTRRQALEAALHAEVKAYGFFVAVLPSVKDVAVRGLLEELRLEEVQHQELVKAEIAKLPPSASEPPPDAYGDDPVSQ